MACPRLDNSLLEVHMDKLSKNSISWETRVIWAGRLMYVDWVSSTHIHLCPFRMCIGLMHDHISVARWLLYFDESYGFMRPIWDQRSL
jgi:hypothetical protein